MGNTYSHGRVYLAKDHERYDINKYNYVNPCEEKPSSIKITVFCGNMFTGKTTAVKKYIQERPDLHPIIINPEDDRERYISLEDIAKKSINELWYNCIVIDDLPSHDFGILNLEKYQKLVHCEVKEIILMTVPFYINSELNILDLCKNHIRSMIGAEMSISPDSTVTICTIEDENGIPYNIPCTITEDEDVSFRPITKVGDIWEKSKLRETSNVRKQKTIPFSELNYTDLIQMVRNKDYINFIKGYTETDEDSPIIGYDVLISFPVSDTSSPTPLEDTSTVIEESTPSNTVNLEADNQALPITSE